MTYSPPCCIISLHTKIHERGVLYVRLIIQQKNLIGRLYRYFYIYFETFSVPTIETLFLLVLSMLALESADSIRFLYQLSFRYYGKITECILLRLFLCKGRLFQIYECNCFHGFEAHTRFLKAAACLSVHWRYHDFKIRKEIWRCFHSVRPCCTQRFKLSERTLLCQYYVVWFLFGRGINPSICPCL